MPQGNDPFAELEMNSTSSAPLAGRSRPSQGALTGRSASSRPASPRPAQQPDVRRRKPAPSRYSTPIAPSDPFADIEFEESDQQKKRKNKKNRKPKNSVSFSPGKKIKDKKQKEKSAASGSLLYRIRQYFKVSSPRDIYLDVLNWIASHPYMIILVCVIFIGIGMFFGRYTSFAAAFVLAILGALMSREELDTASFFCYGCAFADFLIPYLI